MIFDQLYIRYGVGIQVNFGKDYDIKDFSAIFCLRVAGNYK